MENKDELDQQPYMSEAFWAPVIAALDKKIQIVCTQFGYGKVQVTFIIKADEVLDVMYSDEIRVRGFPTREKKNDYKDKVDNNSKT